jgi:hypothetical protein
LTTSAVRLDLSSPWCEPSSPLAANASAIRSSAMPSPGESRRRGVCQGSSQGQARVTL